MTLILLCTLLLLLPSLAVGRHRIENRELRGWEDVSELKKCPEDIKDNGFLYRSEFAQYVWVATIERAYDKGRLNEMFGDFLQGEDLDAEDLMDEITLRFRHLPLDVQFEFADEACDLKAYNSDIDCEGEFDPDELANDKYLIIEAEDAKTIDMTLYDEEVLDDLADDMCDAAADDMADLIDILIERMQEKGYSMAPTPAPTSKLPIPTSSPTFPDRPVNILFPFDVRVSGANLSAGNVMTGPTGNVILGEIERIVLEEIGVIEYSARKLDAAGSFQSAKFTAFLQLECRTEYNDSTCFEVTTLISITTGNESPSVMTARVLNALEAEHRSSTGGNGVYYFSYLPGLEAEESALSPSDKSNKDKGLVVGILLAGAGILLLSLLFLGWQRAHNKRVLQMHDDDTIPVKTTANDHYDQYLYEEDKNMMPHGYSDRSGPPSKNSSMMDTLVARLRSQSSPTPKTFDTGNHSNPLARLRGLVRKASADEDAPAAVSTAVSQENDNFELVLSESHSNEFNQHRQKNTGSNEVNNNKMLPFQKSGAESVASKSVTFDDDATEHSDYNLELGTIKNTANMPPNLMDFDQLCQPVDSARFASDASTSSYSESGYSASPSDYGQQAYVENPSNTHMPNSGSVPEKFLPTTPFDDIKQLTNAAVENATQQFAKIMQLVEGDSPERRDGRQSDDQHQVESKGVINEDEAMADHPIKASEMHDLTRATTMKSVRSHLTTTSNITTTTQQMSNTASAIAKRNIIGSKIVEEDERDNRSDDLIVSHRLMASSQTSFPHRNSRHDDDSSLGSLGELSSVMDQNEYKYKKSSDRTEYKDKKPTKTNKGKPQESSEFNNWLNSEINNLKSTGEWNKISKMIDTTTKHDIRGATQGLPGTPEQQDPPQINRINGISNPQFAASPNHFGDESSDDDDPSSAYGYKERQIRRMV